MAIDDPVDIVIRSAEQAVDADESLTSALLKIGLSAAGAAVLVASPFLAQIFTGLLSTRWPRAEKRLLEVAKELEAQQKRIAATITDKSYYQSEEFQSLLGLVLEKLHTTHDEEKLRSFGAALANSGSSEFRADDKEEYIRTLRDLSRHDLEVLNNEYLKGWTPHTRVIKYEGEVLSSLSRLVGMGLVRENLRVQMIASDVPMTPIRTYSLSSFGERFLQFINSGGSSALS